MKRLFLFVYVLIQAYNLSAQDIKGEWIGHFTYFKGDFFVSNDKTPITLKIDSLSSGFSYTKSKDEYGLDTTYIQRIKVERLSKDSFKISEINEIDTKNDESMQIMFLKLIGSSPPKLLGTWESKFGIAKFNGEIKLTKKK